MGIGINNSDRRFSAAAPCSLLTRVPVNRFELIVADLKFLSVPLFLTLKCCASSLTSEPSFKQSNYWVAFMNVALTFKV